MNITPVAKKNNSVFRPSQGEDKPEKNNISLPKTSSTFKNVDELTQKNLHP